MKVRARAHARGARRVGTAFSEVKVCRTMKPADTKIGPRRVYRARRNSGKGLAANMPGTRPRTKDSDDIGAHLGGKSPSMIGDRLRDLRTRRSLSIADLSRRAKVSVGMISQIERGITNPSVRIMELLRTALAVPLTSLLESNSGDGHRSTDWEFVRRAAGRPSFRVGDMTKELLSPHGQHELQMLVITLPGGGLSADVVVGKGEKAGLVLSGEIVLRVGSRQAKLSAGDSFQFPSTMLHSVQNDGTKAATFLWIINTVPAKPSL